MYALGILYREQNKLAQAEPLAKDAFDGQRRKPASAFRQAPIIVVPSRN
jgi:hypothetical protein